jgi:hypothetical protein
MRGTQSAACGVVAALLILSGQTAGARGPDTVRAAEQKDVRAAGLSGWREAPAFLPLLTAEPDHPGTYRVYVSSVGIDAVLRDLGADPTLQRPPGAWVSRASLPLEAIGLDGRFDRGRVARLYGARRPHVARGPRVGPDGSRESWTLLSPYPDAELRSLEPGTLLIVLRLP